MGWWKLGRGSRALLVAKGPYTPPQDGGLRGESGEPGGWGRMVEKGLLLPWPGGLHGHLHWSAALPWRTVQIRGW